MSLVNLAHVCSHLQNASKARLGLTSIPSTKLNLSFALALQKQGFLSSVQRAGPDPPDPTESPTSEAALAEAKVKQDNVATRRLWLGLKYWNQQPVLSELQLISKPTRRIWMQYRDLARLSKGRKTGIVKAVSRPGECVFVSTDRGLLEIREAVERRTGGMLLCRVL